MLRDVVKSIRKINMEKLAFQSVMDHKEEAIDLNTQEQLFEQGIDSKGRDLGEYTPFTVEIKKQKGQKTDFITLKDEGDFYDGFYVKSRKFPVIFGSKDSKTNKIVQRFGTDVFGLTKSSVKELNEEYVREDIQEKFKKNISEAFSLLQ